MRAPIRREYTESRNGYSSHSEHGAMGHRTLGFRQGPSRFEKVGGYRSAATYKLRDTHTHTLTYILTYTHTRNGRNASEREIGRERSKDASHQILIQPEWDRALSTSLFRSHFSFVVFVIFFSFFLWNRFSTSLVSSYLPPRFLRTTAWWGMGETGEIRKDNGKETKRKRERGRGEKRRIERRERGRKGRGEGEGREKMVLVDEKTIDVAEVTYRSNILGSYFSTSPVRFPQSVQIGASPLFQQIIRRLSSVRRTKFAFGYYVGGTYRPYRRSRPIALTTSRGAAGTAAAC